MSERLSSFRSHSDSISVRSGNQVLDFHYDLAKLYFVSKYYRGLQRYMTAKICFSYMINRRKNPYMNHEMRKIIHISDIDLLLVTVMFIKRLNEKITLFWR